MVLRSIRRSSEAQALLTCARTRFEPEHEARVRDLTAAGLDWDFVISLGERHWVTAHLYTNLVLTEREWLSRRNIDRLRASFRTKAMRSLVLTRELLRVLEVLAGDDIRVLPYKGPALAYQLYGRPEMREMGDLDLLVAPAFAARACASLIRSGFVPETPLNGRQATALLRSARHRTVVDQGTGLRVEIHWAVAPPALGLELPFDDLWARAGKIQIGSVAVPVMSAEDTLISLCAHGTAHLWEGLSMVMDVAELVATQEIDWHAVLGRAMQTRARRMTSVGLLLAQSLLQARVPPHVIRQACADTHAVQLSLTMEAHLVGARPVPGTFCTRTPVNLRLIENHGAQLRYVLTKAFLPNENDFRAAAIPDPLFPLYWVFRPVRILTDRLTKMR